jgi:predicted permease
MKKMILVLVLSFGSVLIGYLAQNLVLGSAGNQKNSRQRSISNTAKWIKLVTLGALLPLPIFFTFWRIESIPANLMIIPFLGIGSLIVGGLSALIFIRITKIVPDKAGSLFACGMMTNLGIIGGLIGMLFFGNEGFLTVQLFTMFEVFTYYLIVFPLTQQIGEGGGTGFHFNPKLLFSKPMALVPLSAIIAGILFRSLNVPAPPVLDSISAVVVPSVTALIGFSIGLTLKVSRIRHYRREAGIIAGIKFLIIPGIIIPAAALLGLPDMLGGVAFKMVIFLSFGPVALIALVPPQLYGLDLDLANSGWLVTTAVHLLIVPVLILLLV